MDPIYLENIHSNDGGRGVLEKVQEQRRMADKKFMSIPQNHIYNDDYRVYIAGFSQPFNYGVLLGLAENIGPMSVPNVSDHGRHDVPARSVI